MVGSVGDIGEKLAKLVMNGSDNRNVGKMRSAKARMIGNDDVARFKQ